MVLPPALLRRIPTLLQTRITDPLRGCARSAAVVAGLALAASIVAPGRLPALIEVGPDDFRISFSDAPEAMTDPQAAYSPVSDVYLVVWSDRGGCRSFGQRIDGAGGVLVGDRFELRYLEDPCALDPAVAYDSLRDRFGVVFVRDQLTGLRRTDLIGLTVDAATGAVSEDIFLVGHVGDENPIIGDVYPALAFSPEHDHYLLAWNDKDDGGGEDIWVAALRGEDLLVKVPYRQRVSGFAVEPPDTTFYEPAVAVNSVDGEYLVAWAGWKGAEGLEIYGQLLSYGGQFAEIGPDDFRISEMGPADDPGWDGLWPAAAFDPVTRRYYVVWYGDDDRGSLANGEAEIYGQAITVDGVEVGPDDLRLSRMGADGDPDADAAFPALVYEERRAQFLVIWQGDGEGALGPAEQEMFAQRIDPVSLGEVGADDFRFSAMGSDGDDRYDARGLFNALAAGGADGVVLAAWAATSPALDEGRTELFGQLLELNQAPTVTLLQPAPGSLFQEAEPVTMTAAATDLEDGDLGAAITWSSSLDGHLGEGETVVRSLSSGRHDLTAAVADLDGLPAAATATVFVESEACPGDVRLEARRVDGAESWVAVREIALAADLEVAPTGRLALTVGGGVALEAGFRIEAGGGLTVVVDARPCPPVQAPF